MNKLTKTERTTLALTICLVGVLGYIIGQANGKGTPVLDGDVVGAALIATCVKERGNDANTCASDIMQAIYGHR